MEQGTNGRGSFADVLLAVAGGILASDVKRERDRPVDFAVGDRFVLGDGTVDVVIGVQGGNLRCRRTYAAGAWKNPEIPDGCEFDIPTLAAHLGLSMGTATLDISARPPYAFRSTLRVESFEFSGRTAWRVVDSAGIHCYNPVTFVWERIDCVGASTHYTRFLSQQIAEGVRANCTVAPPEVVADTASVKGCTVEDPTQDHTADRAERNDVLINKTGHPLPSWPAAEDPIAEVDHKLNMVRLSTIAETDTHITVNKRHWAELRKSIARLSAGKVEKPAKLEKPSAAANTNELATAIEGADDDVVDFDREAREIAEEAEEMENALRQMVPHRFRASELLESVRAWQMAHAEALKLIPNTYVEDPDNICAAISNMVSHIDRLKRSVNTLTGAEVVNRVCESCRAAVKAAMGKGDIPGVVQTGQS